MSMMLNSFMVAPSGPPDTTPPTIIAPLASAGNTENTPLGISLAANEAVAWSIRTSAEDAASVDYTHFAIIGGNSLEWAGSGIKDYETPGDANGDNAYVFVLRATDGSGNFTDLTVTVTVVDADESGGGGNKLINPGYDDGTAWTTTGGCSIGGGVAHFNDPLGDGARVSQAVATVNNGVSYTVTGTVSNRAQGGLLVIVGTVSIGTVSANGPFSKTGYAIGSGIVAFQAANGGAVLDLDDVSCVAT